MILQKKNFILCIKNIKKENVGRLLRPNRKHFSKSIADDRKLKGFTRENDFDCLGVGEVVIVDKDHMYDLNTKNIQDIYVPSNYFDVQFGERYKEENHRDISSNKYK